MHESVYLQFHIYTNIETKKRLHIQFYIVSETALPTMSTKYNMGMREIEIPLLTMLTYYKVYMITLLTIYSMYV